MKPLLQTNPAIARLRDLNLVPADSASVIRAEIEHQYSGTDTSWLLDVVSTNRKFAVIVMSEPARDNKVKRILQAMFPDHDVGYGPWSFEDGGWRVLIGASGSKEEGIYWMDARPTASGVA